MKRYGNLWEKMVDFGNLYSAYRKARRGKRRHREVERFEFDRAIELTRVRQELINRTYRPGQYRTFTLYDTKARLISAAPFRDRIVHHALCNVIEPIFERTFIHDSYASRRGKGTHAAIHRYQQFSRTHKYVLKCDVRKFFPSIDHAILKQRLTRKIKDADVLDLTDKILDGSNRQVDVAGLFPGDDLLTQLERRRGLPIGNQTSQFFGNVYLDALDHFVKEELRCRAYIRYVDDFVLLSNDKFQLNSWRSQIEMFLVSIRLWLHPQKRVISRVDEGIRFLGFRVWPHRIWFCKAYVRRVRKRLLRYQANCQRGSLGIENVTRRVQSWLGHALSASGHRYAEDVLSDIVFSRTATESSLCSRWELEQQREEYAYQQPQQERSR